MSERMEYYVLLVFDHLANQLIDIQEFDGDEERAVAAYVEVEALHGESTSVEVVLIGSDSLEMVRRTHANYFGTASTSKYLAGI